MTQEFTRAALYELVWSQPLRTLAKSIGVSDVAIAKRCREANIPLPGLGYWAKKEAGKPVIQAKLPPRGLGQSDHIIIGKYDPYGRGPSEEELIEMKLPERPRFDEEIDQVKARALALAARVRGSTLDRLHPAAAKVVEQDEIRRRKAAETNYSWYKAIFDQPNGKRRLRMLNSLLNALASIGCKCSASAKDGYELSVVVGNVRLNLSLAPTGFDRQKHYYGNLVPNNGTLILQVEWHRPDTDVPASWSDADGPLEKRLSEIVSGLLVVAECGYREGLLRGHGFLVERKARAIEERDHRLAEAAKQERERIEREAKKRLDALLTDVRAWRTAAEIRAYVGARVTNTTDSPTLRDWAAWALAEAQRIDPLH